MGNEVSNDSLNTTYCSECNINFDNSNDKNNHNCQPNYKRKDKWLAKKEEIFKNEWKGPYCPCKKYTFSILGPPKKIWNGVNLGGPIVPGLDIDETKLPQFKDPCYRQCSNCGEHFNKHSPQALEGYNFRIGFLYH